MNDTVRGGGTLSTISGVNRSYEPYSDDPDYIEGNLRFMTELDLSGDRRLLDLACGIGTLGRLALSRSPGLRVTGLDLSFDGLRIHRDRFEAFALERGLSTREPALVNATADAIPFADESFDCAVMGHSIHLPPDEGRLVAEIARVLRPAGLFAFNTSFYAGTFVEGTERIYHDWTKLALEYVSERDLELRRKGLSGIRRQRRRVPAAFSKPWLSPQEWERLLGVHGFEDVRLSERTVRLTQLSLEGIAAYAGFAEVILSGYPVDVASEALQVAAGRVFRQEGIDEIPRRWLEVTARKRQRGALPGTGMGEPDGSN
jgi:ubiquinone/menaquinone biosynthesis C-methylase UbiE